MAVAPRAVAPQELVVSQKIREIVPMEYQPRLLELFRTVLAEAQRRFAPAILSPTPFKPRERELGVAVLNPKDFNLTTFRNEYAAPIEWKDSLVSDFTTSKFAYILISGYENREAVPKTTKSQWAIGGVTTPPEDIEDLIRTPTHRIGIDPFSIEPETMIDWDVLIEATGYDHLAPVGLVIATQPYLISRTWK